MKSCQHESAAPAAWIPALLGALIVATVSPSTAAADITDSSSTGFTVRNVVIIDAPAGVVYDLLVDHVGSWWEPAHTWSGDASNLSIDARAGGLFQEKLPSGGSVAHMEVVYADRGKLLRMRGGLGPLQGMAVAGSLSLQMIEEGGKTTVTLTYTVTGYAPGGIATLAKPVDTVLGTQLQRFRRFAETGKP